MKYMTFGEKLKKLRVENNLTQKELADKVHVTFQTISKWENDENEPDFSTLRELVKILNTSVDYLLGEDEQKKEEEAPKEGPVEEKEEQQHVCFDCDRVLTEEETRYKSVQLNKYKRGVVTLCPDCYRKEVEKDKEEVKNMKPEPVIHREPPRGYSPQVTSSKSGELDFFGIIIGVAGLLYIIGGIIYAVIAVTMRDPNVGVVSLSLGIVANVLAPILCGIDAYVKRRRVGLWIFLGIILSVIGVVIIGFLPEGDN